MSLLDDIQKSIVESMKAKDQVKVTTLRMLKTECTNAAIQKKKDVIDDDEVLAIIQKQVKQRKDSIESFESAGRTELAEKEVAEMKILQAYLPEQLSPEELKQIVEEAIKESGASSKAEIGKIMKLVMPKVKGRADGKQINQIAGELLN